MMWWEIVMGILGFIILFGAYLVLAFGMLFFLWILLSFLERSFNRFACKVRAYSHNYSTPKFPLGKLTSNLVDCINYTCNYFQKCRVGIHFGICRQIGRGHIASDKMVNPKPEQRYTEEHKSPETFPSPLSHTATLPQEKQGVNQNGTLPLKSF